MNNNISHNCATIFFYTVVEYNFLLVCLFIKNERVKLLIFIKLIKILKIKNFERIRIIVQFLINNRLKVSSIFLL